MTIYEDSKYIACTVAGASIPVQSAAYAHVVVCCRLFVNKVVVQCNMMFNGLLMCGDSDASDVTKVSVSSVVPLLSS